MIRKIMVATAAYLGRRVIKRAASNVVKRVFGRGKPEEKAPESAAKRHKSGVK